MSARSKSPVKKSERNRTESAVKSLSRNHQPRTARCSCLDLARAQRHSQVCDGRVLCFAGAVGAHHTPIALLAKLDCVDGFREAADLVHLEQKGVASLGIDGLFDAIDIGHREVIPYHLRWPADLLCEESPSIPVILVEGVLDGDDREVLAQAGIELGQLCPSHLQGWVTFLGFRIPKA